MEYNTKWCNVEEDFTNIKVGIYGISWYTQIASIINIIHHLNQEYRWGTHWNGECCLPTPLDWKNEIALERVYAHPSSLGIFK